MLAFQPRGSFVPTALGVIAPQFAHLTRHIQRSRFNSKARLQPTNASPDERASASGRGRKQTTARKGEQQLLH
jgi:hypothetical protein